MSTKESFIKFESIVRHNNSNFGSYIVELWFDYNHFGNVVATSSWLQITIYNRRSGSDRWEFSCEEFIAFLVKSKSKIGSSKMVFPQLLAEDWLYEKPLKEEVLRIADNILGDTTKRWELALGDLNGDWFLSGIEFNGRELGDVIETSDKPLLTIYNNLECDHRVLPFEEFIAVLYKALWWASGE